MFFSEHSVLLLNVGAVVVYLALYGVYVVVVVVGRVVYQYQKQQALAASQVQHGSVNTTVTDNGQSALLIYFLLYDLLWYGKSRITVLRSEIVDEFLFCFVFFALILASQFWSQSKPQTKNK